MQVEYWDEDDSVIDHDFPPELPTEEAMCDSFFFFFFFCFFKWKIYILTVQNSAEQHVIRECKIVKVKVRATKSSDIVKCTERGRHIGGRGVIQVFKNLERCWFRR